MKLKQIIEALKQLTWFEGGNVVSYREWINDAILEIANDFSLPALRLKEPTSLTVTESDWLYDLPNTYMKKVFKCYDSDYNKIIIKRSLDDLDELNIEHNDTGDHVTHIAVRDTQIGIYPMADENIKLWFYEKPTELVNPDDELTCIPSQYQYRVVVSKVMIRNFNVFFDFIGKEKSGIMSLQWWRNNYSEGLFGSPNGDVGMLNCFARAKGVRRHGGKNPLP